ncbi:MAG TPA: hypothetical protein EYQ11_06775 [Candidatus Poseidoniales archaeon]|jgi:hypothetical protein|nr:MAG: hypothetical protein CXT66_03230 [Euryarchaeota archaeon]HIG34557.1 hypothetical protein [Candidatus Poseidoniales archaeon]HIL67959.1 hypothetical protein [Candidatus Poseidoniales archaeon]
MAKSFEITKVSVRGRLVVDAKVSMNDPQDFDFSPRASLSGSILSLINDSGKPSSTFELDAEQVTTAERDRMVELRVKFNVQGMHGVLTQKTLNPKTGPKSKKLAEPSWKTILPLSM